ncbi:MAG: hypothetical protein ACM30G_06845 [Micromonosporaceae bacterium]
MAEPRFDGWDEPTLAETSHAGLRTLIPPGRTISSHRAGSDGARRRRVLVSLLILAVVIGLVLGLAGLSGRWHPAGATGRFEDESASRGGLRPAVPAPRGESAPPSQPTQATAPSAAAPSAAAPSATAPPGTPPRAAMAAPATAEPRPPRPTVRPTTTVTPTPRPSPAATPTPSPAATPAPSASVPRTVAAYLTGYSYFDNTPPGSVDISHPVLHQSAGGAGTYADPITVAVGHSLVGGQDILDWPAGTRFYVPNLRRYFIVEDTCGDGSTPENGPCHTGYPATATTWLDLWVGGSGAAPSGAAACVTSVTGVWDVLVDPAPNYATEPGDIYGSAGCAQPYGNAVVTP